MVKKAMRGAPMKPRSDLGYESDVQLLERLQRAVTRDLRFSSEELTEINWAIQKLIEKLRPYLAGQKKGKGT